MDLTPEQKNRIYQEEKARLNAQEQIKQEQNKAKKAAESKKMQLGCLGCLGLLAIVFVVGYFMQGEKPKGAPASSSTSSSYIDLKAFIQSEAIYLYHLKFRQFRLDECET